MPGVSDDIIIKLRTLTGLLKAAKHEAKQIEKNDMLSECKDLDEALHNAYVPFRDTLIRVTEEMKDRLTKRLAP